MKTDTLQLLKVPAGMNRSATVAAPVRTAPSWLYQAGSGDWRRKELMTGAIHRPQRSTRTACSTRPTKPRALKSCFSGDSERLNSAASTKKLIENSGAAMPQLMTPDSDSLKNSRTPLPLGPRSIVPNLLNSG